MIVLTSIVSGWGTACGGLSRPRRRTAGGAGDAARNPQRCTGAGDRAAPTRARSPAAGVTPASACGVAAPTGNRTTRRSAGVRRPGHVRPAAARTSSGLSVLPPSRTRARRGGSPLGEQPLCAVAPRRERRRPPRRRFAHLGAQVRVVDQPVQRRREGRDIAERHDETLLAVVGQVREVTCPVP